MVILAIVLTTKKLYKISNKKTSTWFQLILTWNKSDPFYSRTRVLVKSFETYGKLKGGEKLFFFLEML